MRHCLPPEMGHLVRIAFPSLLGEGLDKLLECLAVQLDVSPRLLRPLLCLAFDLRSGPARGDVGTVVEKVDELERVELIHLWPVAKREPHGTHDKDATPLPRAVQADWVPPKSHSYDWDPESTTLGACRPVPNPTALKGGGERRATFGKAVGSRPGRGVNLQGTLRQGTSSSRTARATSQSCTLTPGRRDLNGGDHRGKQIPQIPPQRPNRTNPARREASQLTIRPDATVERDGVLTLGVGRSFTPRSSIRRVRPDGTYRASGTKVAIAPASAIDWANAPEAKG